MSALAGIVRNALAGFVLAALAFSCKEAAPARKEGARADQATAPREVRLARVANQKLAKTLAITGTLAADEQVTVSVKVGGRLASIAVDLGSVVQRGQAIAQVEQTDYQLKVEQAASLLAQARALLGLSPDGDDSEIDVEATSLVQEARATLEEARANFERANGLFSQRLIPPAELDNAKANFARAQSALSRAQDEIRTRQAALRQRTFELRSARQQLADTVVRSPLDGTVQQRIALAGEYLAAGASVATIVRVDPLRLRAEVAERDAPQVAVGQTVRVTLEGDPTSYQGKVARLAPALNEQNRSLMIEAEIANPGTLRPGSFARGEIVMQDTTEVPVVPRSAVVTFAGIEKVITVEDGRAVEKPIETGRRTEQWSEIISGLQAGDAIVEQPGNLQQGQAVTIAAGP